MGSVSTFSSRTRMHFISQRSYEWSFCERISINLITDLRLGIDELLLFCSFLINFLQKDVISHCTISGYNQQTTWTMSSPPRPRTASSCQVSDSSPAPTVQETTLYRRLESVMEQIQEASISNESKVISEWGINLQSHCCDKRNKLCLTLLGHFG